MPGITPAMKRTAALLSLVLLCGSTLSLAAEPTAEPEGLAGAAAARAVVESLHDVLLSCMKEADALGLQGRYERILASIDQTYDLPFMARLSVGTAWKELSEQERTDFVDLSRRLSATKYASNFDGYGGQRFDTLGDEAAARGTLVVKTQLVQPEDDDVLFDYRLRDAGDGWRIIDVQLDGKVSELTMRRADYQSVIRREGFPQLVEDLKRKIVKLSKE